MDTSINKDSVTDAAASLGLLNGSLAVNYGLDGWTLSSKHSKVQLGKLDTLPKKFYDAAGIASVALAALSMKDPDVYDAILADITESGTSGYLVCRPKHGIWPDAMLDADPEHALEEPSGRCFPLAHLAADCAVTEIEPDYVTEWCATNAGMLAVEEIGPNIGSVLKFTGWSTAVKAPVSFMAHLWDCSVPWRVTAMPDGSDMIVPAEPFERIDALFNAWAPMKLVKKNGDAENKI